MLTLEQAIEHAEEVAEENEKSLRGWKECINRGTVGWSDFDKEKVDTSMTRCSKCATEHRQLAAWLRELQERREKDNKIGHGNARWLINSDGYYPYCSACMAEPKDGKMTDICPSCGARMEGKIT